MAEVSVRVNLTREEVRKRLAELPRTITSGTSVGSVILDVLGLTLLANIKEAFIIKARGGTDASGLKWAPLRPSTIARRKKGKPGAPAQQGTYEILRDTGLLLNSLTPGSASPDQVLNVSLDSVTVGTKRAGAADHHNGVPARRLPQRRLWPEPDKWPDDWWEDLHDVLRSGIVHAIAQSMH